MEKVESPMRNAHELLLGLGIIFFFFSFIAGVSGNAAYEPATEASISRLSLSIAFGLMGMTAWMSGFQLYLKKIDGYEK